MKKCHNFRLPTAIGFVLCSYSFSWDGRTIYMRNLLVNETHRSKGVGKLLVDAVLRHCKETGCSRLELHVADSNLAKNFYQKMGAINVTEKDGKFYYRFYKDVIDRIDA